MTASKKGNGRGFLLQCLSQPVRSVRYITATQAGKSSQAQHDRVAQFVNLEFAHGTYEFGYLGQFIFAGPACNNALTNCAALLCRTQRRFNRMCSSTVSDTANRLRKTRKKKSSVVPPFRSGHMSAICARPSKGKGEIYKRVENRRLSTLLCARAASAQFRSPRRRNPIEKEISKNKKF